MNNKVFENILIDLDDLCFRLQEDYGVGEQFEQKDEDRLVVYNTIEILENLERFVKGQLSTYPCNETLETILKIMNMDIDIGE